MGQNLRLVCFRDAKSDAGILVLNQYHDFCNWLTFIAGSRVVSQLPAMNVSQCASSGVAACSDSLKHLGPIFLKFATLRAHGRACKKQE